MPDISRQKYGLRIALKPSNAFEAVTTMDLKAVQEEIKNAREHHRDCKFDCVNPGSDEYIAVLCSSEDIQLILHHKWEQARIQVPQAQVPDLRGVHRMQ